MRVVSRLFGLIAAGAVIAGSAQAQTCNGFSSLQSHKMNIAATAWFADGASEFGGQFNTSVSSLFLGLGVSSFKADGADESLMRFHGNLGLEKTTSGGLSWCPLALVRYASKDDVTSMDLGVKLGVAKEMAGSSMKFVPFGSIGLVRFSQSIDNCPVSALCEFDDTNFEFGVGVGFRFNNGMQISPQLMKSSAEESDVIFGATVSFPFGMR
jgi:hypothetical protein